MNIKSKAQAFIVVMFFLWVVACSKSGSADWHRIWGTDKHDQITSLTSFSNGVIASGERIGEGKTSYDAWVSKLELEDSTITTVWEKTFPAEGTSYTTQSLVLNDGSIVVSGYTFTPDNRRIRMMRVFRLDTNGNVIWDKIFEDQYDGLAVSVAKDSKENLIIAGYVVNQESFFNDVMLIKINTSGETIWEKNLGTGNIADLLVDENNSIYLAAYLKQESVRGPQFGLIKTTSEGEIIWRRQYKGDWENTMFSMSASSEGILIVGDIGSQERHTNDFWLVFVDDKGTKLWDKRINNYEFDRAFDVIATDKGFVVTGVTSNYEASEVMALTVDSKGKIKQQDTFSFEQKNTARAVTLINDKILLGGYVSDQEEKNRDNLLILLN